MPDVLDEQLIDHAASKLRPLDARVFRALANPLGELRPGEDLAREVWPEKEWLRSRNAFQVSVHQVRLRLGTDVVERKGSRYGIDRSALEAFILRSQYETQNSLNPSAESSLAATLSFAAASDQVEVLFFWGRDTCAGLIELSEQLWRHINAPEGCPVWLCLGAADWRSAVQLVSLLESATGKLGIDELCQRCTSRFGIFITAPLLASGQICRGRDDSVCTAEILPVRGAATGIEFRSALAFYEEIRWRWALSEGAQGAALIVCDVQDVAARACRQHLGPYYTTLTGATASETLLTGAGGRPHG